MPFAVAMIWREPKENSFYCYNILTIITPKYKQPDLPAAVRPVSHSEELSVPQPPENLTFNDDNYNSIEDHGQLKGTMLIVN